MKNNSSMYSIPNKFINKIIIQLKNKATKSKKILDHGEYKHDNQFIRNQLKNKKTHHHLFYSKTQLKRKHTESSYLIIIYTYIESDKIIYNNISSSSHFSILITFSSQTL